MIKAILFDIDGTLLDTRDQLITFISGTIHEVYGTALPDTSIDILIKDHEIFQDSNLHLITKYDAVASTLETLKNRRIAFGAVTGRRKKSALSNLLLHNMENLFDVIITPEDVEKAKPDYIIDSIPELPGLVH